MSGAWRIPVGNSTFRDLSAELRVFFARRIYGRGDPSDLVMKVWISGGRHYQGRASLRHYLYTVARTVLADFWRAQGRRLDITSGEFDELIGDRPTSTPGCESELMRLKRREAVWDSLGQVREAYRQTLQLWLAGMDGVQIATALGVPYNTVRSRLVRGREQLARLLAENSD